MIINISDLGAVGDGKYINTTIIQQAIDECSKNGGGRVVISNGKYVSGTIILKSNIELHIAAGATLVGSADCLDYPELKDVKHFDGTLVPRGNSSCLIFADECENIAITGQGTIDCNGDAFVEPHTVKLHGWPYKRKNLPTPPRVVLFAGCKNVIVTDISMANQPAGWSYWVHDCDYVCFDRVKIYANVDYPNNDGIHINCSRDVTVSNCSITCGDDCIVLRANSVSLKENKICERIVISNCNLTSYASGIRIGWINDGIIRNCTISNIVMTDTTCGISIVLPYRRPASVNVRFPDPSVPVSTDIGREETLIENLSFHNIIMDLAYSNPIWISVANNPLVKCRAIRNIFFSDIHSRGPAFPRLEGRAENLISNVWFSNCSFELTDGLEFSNYTHHGYAVFPAEVDTHCIVKYVKALRAYNTVPNLEIVKDV